MPLDRTPSLWFTAAGPPEKLIAIALLVKDIPMRYSTLLGAIRNDTKVSESTAERLIRDAKKAGVLWQGDDGQYRANNKRFQEPSRTVTGRATAQEVANEQGKSLYSRQHRQPTVTPP